MYSIVFNVLVLNLAVISHENEFDLSICGTKYVACFCDTNICNITKSNALAKYQYDKVSDQLIIWLWTKHNWVAFGQRFNKSSNFMVNLRGQYCVRSNNILVGNFNGNSLTSNGKPDWLAQGNEIILLESGSLNDGSFFCKFKRSASIIGNSFYNLTYPHYGAIAFGSTLDGDLPSYHYKSYKISNESINFLTSIFTDSEKSTIRHTQQTLPAVSKTNNYFTTTVNIPETDNNVSSNISKLDLSKCGKEYNCFLHPKSCTTNCKAIATFYYDKFLNKIVKELWSSSSNVWVAFAQKLDNSNAYFMVNLKGQYCLKGSSSVKFGSLDATSITENTEPNWVEKIPGVEMVSSAIYDDGSFSCRYLCSFESSSDKEYYLAIAFGSSLNGEHPGYHGSTGYFKSEGNVNLMAIQKVSSESSLSAFIKGHGILMTMAWLLFATCGIFISRYMKTVCKEKIYGKDGWFRMHQIFMFSTLTCFIIGFILILFELKGKWSTTAGTHHVLGLIAIIFGLLQPCVALLRCSPDHEKRYIFNWVHRTIGMVAWLIAAITIVFGLKMVGLDTNATVVIIFIPVTAVLFVTLDLLRIWNTKYNKDKLTANSQVTYSATQSLIETEYRKSNNEKLNLKLILTVTMAVFYVFAALVVIVIAINIGNF